MLDQDVQNKIQNACQNLDETERTILKTCLRRVRNQQDCNFLIEYLRNPIKWRCPRVSMDTFLNDPYYLGEKITVYPEIKKILTNVQLHNCLEVLLVIGVGGGKSTLAEILACYAAHNLLCLRTPHKNYGLSDDKPITVLNMGTSATQAYEVVFTGIKSLIEKSVFFYEFKPEIRKTQIMFPYQKIMLRSGNSKDTTPLGYNIFYAILDEAAFFLDNDNRSVAEDLYNALQKRIMSRFGSEGTLVTISSPRYEGDFIMKKFTQLQKFKEDNSEASDRFYIENLPTWKVKHFAEDTECFYFNPHTEQIIPKENIDEFTIVNKLFSNWNLKAEIWEIPKVYERAFIVDPSRAKRDLGAKPSNTIEGFFPNREIVSRVFSKEILDPVIAPGKYQFIDQPLRTPYYIHIDLGLNKKGKGDKAAMCMGHFDGYRINKITGERLKTVRIDFIEEIGMNKALGEVEIESVRRRIYDLKAKGYQIAIVSIDGYASQEMFQILGQKGFTVEYLSVDRTIEPYNILKELIYDNRIIIPYHKITIDELHQLEITKAKKIDHIHGGKKDCSDTLAGVSSQVITHTTENDFGIATGNLNEIRIQQKKMITDYQKEMVQLETEKYNELVQAGLI